METVEGIRTGTGAPPVGLHFHSHGLLAVRDAGEWQADPACAGGSGAPGCRGTRHPTAYVEANGHGMFPAAGATALADWLPACRDG